MQQIETRDRNIVAAERRAKAVELRKAGHSLREIGAELGVSLQAVAKMINKELSELHDVAEKDAEILREQELLRLDTMQRSIWPDVELGETAAIDRVLRIMERRAKLLGIDAPTRSEVDASLNAGGQLHVYLPDNGRFDPVGGSGDK